MTKVVYFIRAGKGGPVKVGWASDVKSRFRQIAQGLPEHGILEATLPGGRGLEKRIHGALHQSHRRLEWFNPTKEVNALVIVAKRLGLDAVERWLAVKEAEFQPRKPDFDPSGDFDADVRWLTGFAFKSAVARYGYETVCEAVGLSYDTINKYIHKKSVPTFVTFFKLAQLDPGAVVPAFALAGDVPPWIESITYNNPEVRAA